MEPRSRLPLLLPLLGLAAAAAFAAPDLSLGPKDFRIEQRGDPGYHLFIRQKAGVSSVLLAESTSDPARKADNFAYRDPVWRAVNGDERRMLNGAFLPTGKGNWWLIDSSPEADPELGSAFHIFIPWVVDWGHPWSRSGQTFIADGTFVNVRTFTAPYADYRGSYLDNPFLVRVVQKPLPRPLALPAAPAPPPPSPVLAEPPEPEAPPLEVPPDLSLYIPETVATFTDIASDGGGEVRFSDGGKDIVPKLASLLDRPEGRTLDLVFCVDATDSMADDIAAVKQAIPEMLRKETAAYETARIGLLLYKDYFEDYLVRRYEFTSDIGVFGAELAGVKVGGGRDIPEAVYEALYAALTEYAWSAEDRKLILIGDAPPHPLPRGKIDKAMVDAAAADRKVVVDVIILPP